MELGQTLLKKSCIKYENDYKIIFYSGIVICLYLLHMNYYYMFHTSIEIFSAVISFAIFMVYLNTYKLSKNDFLVFLGNGYVYVGMLDIFHAFAYGSMNIIPGASINMVSKFWLMARFFEAATLLLSNLFLYKKVSHQNLSLVQIIYFFVFVLVMHNFARIRVKDTGIGIPQDKFDIIFDRFGQVDKSFTRNKEGSGIGLSLVKTLVEMHGRKITVSSKVGEGSEFIVDLPALILEENEVNNDAMVCESKIDKINIEFSDIYSLEC